jgi:transcriptional regulator with XRE-family HTH domain
MPYASLRVNSLLRCFAVTQAPRRTPPTPDPITAAVGRRVLGLRKSAGWSQEELGKRMAALGTDWSRISVQKLETGRRGAISVQELLALALVFDVPPVWILAYPKSTDSVSVAPGIDVDPWTALAWLVGREPIGDAAPGSRFAEARAALAELQRLGQGLAAIRATEDARAEGGGVLEADRPDEDRRLIGALVRPLELLVRWGYPAPTLPGSVRQRAKELDVDLPGAAED